MFLIASRFPNPPLACAFFSSGATVNTNVVNAPQEPFVVKQDHGVNSSQNPPYIDECCYECGDALDGIFCQQCTCKSYGKGAHIGYNCPPKVLIISNLEPCNQTMNNEHPQTLPSFDPTCYSKKENSLPCVSKPNFVDESPNIFNPPPQPPISSCEFCWSNAQYGHYCTPQKIPICYDDDVDYTIAITPVLSIEEPDNSLSMGDEHLDTILATESDEIIKSSVEDLVPIPSESEDYEAFSFYDEHIEEISSGSTTTPSDISLSEYVSFNFDLSNDQFPPTDRSDFTYEEFTDELAHIISLPEYECFYFRNFPIWDYPDCEVFRALRFSFTRALHPQLHFGNPISKSYRLTFSFVLPNKWP
uniref:Uncharacterized protein n=1 Tax=Tanacetum cinerariifolium TaxID=118510 RepID=A0A6L2NU99_TANCI|nr:hypothetical protein [Tanacetum cinerariifolium]